MKIRFGWPTMILLGAVGGLLAVGGVMYTRNAARTNHVALADSAKKVAAIAAVAAPYQPHRRYVGTVEPWQQAKVGPQLVAAYVDTVLVRPGAAVKRGEVIATLDCRHASALSQQVAQQARAVDAMSTAAESEATRVSSLLDGKFVSENEADLKKADAASKQAQLAALKAQLAGSTLQVDDCVLRAPFDGEIAERTSDPGAFVRPGMPIATVVDRHLVRITADVPEDDFEAVAPDTPVRLHLLATHKDLVAKISRRAPSADQATRTAHIEIDVEDAARAIPTWTTAELAIDVGTPVPATALPLTAASVHSSKATLFVVKTVNGGTTAHTTLAKVVGEDGGTLFVDPGVLPAGTPVVTDGRTTLSDGDTVASTTMAWKPEVAQ
ncbi:MAG TPA: efflux RND transporter periplasmic adaptor subunit [Kofleriaceae bacterium]|nr:efflux RND transporter periplasmic adaptor subunit [Kofleriaceae bacterium]